MSVSQGIKSRLDIVQYIGRSVPLKRAGRVYKAPCPFHSEKTPSFVVNPDTQSWRCFGACAEGGDIFNFAMKQNGWSFTEALAELGKLAGVEVRKQTPEDRAKDEASERLRGMVKEAEAFYHARLLDESDPKAVATRHYAREKRGLTDETIQKFGIGYAPDGWSYLLDELKRLGYSEDDAVNAGLARRNENGRVYDAFRYRLMIPIRDERGRTVGFGGRALDPDENAKYINSTQSAIFDKSRILFGLHEAAPHIRSSETAVIVEGYMDAIQAHQAGYNNVVAQMGTAMTETQLKLIAPRWAKNIVLSLDNDTAGQNATRRSLEVARQTLESDYAGRLQVDFRVLVVPEAKDPDDLIREHPEQWSDLVTGALPVADFVIAAEVAELPTNASPQQKESLARRVLPLLVASENNIYNEANVQKLFTKLRLPGDGRLLRDWAYEQKKLAAAAPPKRTGDGSRAKSGAPRDGSAYDGPPDLPLILDDSYIPDEDGYGEYVPDVPGGVKVLPRVNPMTATSGARLEAYCLRALFRQPDLVYAVNRKLRELAGQDEALIAGPLCDLAFEDFSTTDYRALIEGFGAAIAQDEAEPMAYLRDHLPQELAGTLDAVMREDFEDLRPRLTSGLSADLEMVMRQMEKTKGAVADPAAELVERCLQLRRERLLRERRELEYALKDTDLEEGQAGVFHQGVALSSRAKAIIDAELRKMAGRVR